MNKPKTKSSTCFGLTKSKVCKCQVKLGSGSAGGICPISGPCVPKTINKEYVKLKTPIKSECDKNDYLAIKLKNGLKAVLIKDNSETEKTAAIAVGVNAGYTSDPPHVQGLAHFLEHMVFMGSEKYPIENAFDVFISSKGGSFNAHTGSEETVYHFSIGNEHMYQAMDIFSQFFISPLLNYDAMSREREAVESEYQLSIADDGRRISQLLMSLGGEDNPFRQFDCGNLETLKLNIEDKRLHEELHAFRKKHYSANKMTLVLQTKYDLTTMASWVVETFSKIQHNMDYEEPKILKDPFPLNNFNKIYFVESLENSFDVRLTWALPSQRYEYKKKALRNIYTLFDEGGLQNWLKNQLYGYRVIVGPETNSLFSFLVITLQLTEEGFRNYLKCIQAVFSFIKFLQDVGPSKDLWIDGKKMLDLTFKFTADDYAEYNVQELVSNLMYYPTEDVIVANKLEFEFDPEYIKYFLSLLTPENVNIMVSSKNVGNDHKLDQAEKWYKTKYTSVNIPNDVKKLWKTWHECFNFSLPKSNPYIPDDFTILPALGINIAQVYPRKIKYSDKYELWYKQDYKFKQPKAYLNYDITSPHTDIKCQVMLELFSALFSNYTKEETAQADSAGLSYSISSNEKGISMHFSGYNQYLHLLIDKVLILLMNFTNTISHDQFDAIMLKFDLEFKNTALSAFSLFSSTFKVITRDISYPTTEKLKILPTITYDQFIRFMISYFDTAYATCLIQGNISEDDACSITEKVVSSLIKYPFKPKTESRVRKLEKGQVNLKVKTFDSNDNNCITGAYFQDKPGTMKELMILKILRMLLKEPIFHQLRTQEQLGYSVSCNMVTMYGILGLNVGVISQSDKTTVEHVEERILHCLITQLKRLQNISNEEFNSIVDTIIKQKSEKDADIFSEFNRNLTEIVNRDYIFDREEKEIEALKTVKPKDVYTYFEKLIGPQRKLLMLHVVSNEDNSSSQDFTELSLVPTEINKPNVTYITDINQFVKKLELYPSHKINQ